MYSRQKHSSESVVHFSSDSYTSAKKSLHLEFLLVVFVGGHARVSWRGQVRRQEVRHQQGLEYRVDVRIPK